MIVSCGLAGSEIPHLRQCDKASEGWKVDTSGRLLIAGLALGSVSPRRTLVHGFSELICQVRHWDKAGIVAVVPFKGQPATLGWRFCAGRLLSTMMHVRAAAAHCLCHH